MASQQTDNALCPANERMMSRERAHDLALQCTELVRKGNDFPTVWATVLKSNALVNGIPESRYQGTRAVLVIRLITGDRLVFDADSKKFRLE
jgi:hypothetical protein